MEEFELIVEGCDGSRWTIHGPRAHGRPLRLLEGSLGEIYDAPLTTTYRAAVGQAGASYRGHRWLERHIVLPIACFGDDWAHHDSRFRRAFAPDRDSILVVRTPMSGERRLRVRLEEGPEFQGSRDPFSQGIVIRRWVLIAGDPYWVEPGQHTSEFVFTGSNWSGDGVMVDNPTDTEAWPQWVLTSPAKFGLPDIDLLDPDRPDRFVSLPFQPTGRTALVDTHPLEETIVAGDGTLMWAQMTGQMFQHPIPPFTPPTRLPVYVDPFPLLPFNFPPTWRMWIAAKLRALVEHLGLDAFLALTPEDIGARIAAWLKGVTPDWLEPINPDLLADMTGDFIARLIRETYGRIGNIAGATAQIRLDRRWTHPWG